MKNTNKISALILSALFALAFVTTQAQTKVVISKIAGKAVSVEDFKLKSKLMNREMPYRVILPVDYETRKTQKYAVIYLLHGLTGHYGNWVDYSHLKQYAAQYNYIIVSIEGDNGWYTDSATIPDDKYESYFIKEMIPEIDGKFRTLADKNHRAVAGLSMGGYGSIKFGMKYPEMFNLVGSFSGALGAAGWTSKIMSMANMGGEIPKSLKTAFGDDDNPLRAENDIFRMVREITPEKVISLPFIYQSCGTEDFLILNNHEFSALLFEKKISHEYREHPGVHDFKFWDDQIKQFLETSVKYLGQNNAPDN